MILVIETKKDKKRISFKHSKLDLSNFHITKNKIQMESNKCVTLSFHQGQLNFVLLIFINGSTTKEYQIRFENKKHLFACKPYDFKERNIFIQKYKK